MTTRKSMPHAITSRSITVCFDGETHAILKGNKGYEELLTAIKDRRWDDVPDIISKAKAIQSYTNDTFTVEGGVLRIDGQEVPSVLAGKILDFKREGLPYEGLVNFAKNLLQNPSFRAVQQLFQFLEKNNHAISEDGCFMAYKWVNFDWFDTYTGKTFKNEPGAVIQMPRNQVNEDPEQTCSYGLHVANWDYALNSYGRGSGGLEGGHGRMLEVLVNPKDVVAVPVDYNNAKMRVCEYKVLGEVKSERKSLYVNQDGSDFTAPPTTSTTGFSSATDDVAGAAQPVVKEDWEIVLESKNTTLDAVVEEYNKLFETYGEDTADRAMEERYGYDVLERVLEAREEEEEEEEEDEESEDDDDSGYSYDDGDV